MADSAMRAAIGPVALKISDPSSAARQIRMRHDYWCFRVDAWLLKQGLTPRLPPSCEMSWLGGRACGKYYSRQHKCKYYLPYAMMLGIDEYDDTIAHEVVHAYQRCLMPRCKFHGESFYILMRLACGYDLKTHTHSYSVRTARHIEKMLAPVKKLFEAAGVTL